MFYWSPNEIDKATIAFISEYTTLNNEQKLNLTDSYKKSRDDINHVYYCLHWCKVQN